MWAASCVAAHFEILAVCAQPSLDLTYSGLVITAQAIRGGAALDAPDATAWMTIAVPPLLNTEWSSVPSVTLGATTLAWAVPSAATIREKSGMSPAGSPV